MFCLESSRRYLLLQIILLVGFNWLSFGPYPTKAIRWLGLYRLPRSADHPTDSWADRFTLDECRQATSQLGLRRRQAAFCNHPRFGYAMLAVLRAAHAVGFHCPKAFADRRWNCTSIHHLPRMSPELRRGTREQALVHAFSSAALLYEIGRYCAMNKIRYCSCGDETDTYQMAGQQQQNSYSNSNGALIYDSSSASQLNQGEAYPSPMSPGTSSTQGQQQQDVSRFYWAGCSDNLLIARQYASAFLGFPNLFTGQSQMNAYDRSGDIEQLELNQNPPQPNGYYRDRRSIENDQIGNYDDEDEEDNFDELPLDLDVNKRQRRDTSAYQWQYNQPYPVNSQPRQTGHYVRQPPPPRPISQHYPPMTGQARRTHPIQHQPPHPPPRRWSRRPPIKRRNKGLPLIRALNYHNYLAGVVLMEANQKLVCKCHGVSGSCAQRVCFRQLRRIDTDVIQNVLKERYLSAKQVIQGPDKRLFAKRFTGTGFVDELVQPNEFVFSEPSPDYCDREPNRGSIGTKGRLCTLTQSGTASCRNMCCGRGYYNATLHQTVKCKCRIDKTFSVKCDLCTEQSVRHHCL